MGAKVSREVEGNCEVVLPYPYPERQRRRGRLYAAIMSISQPIRQIPLVTLGGIEVQVKCGVRLCSLVKYCTGCVEWSVAVPRWRGHYRGITRSAHVPTPGPTTLHYTSLHITEQHSTLHMSIFRSKLPSPGPLTCTSPIMRIHTPHYSTLPPLHHTQTYNTIV